MAALLPNQTAGFVLGGVNSRRLQQKVEPKPTKLDSISKQMLDPPFHLDDK